MNEGAYVFIMGRRDPELAAAVKEIGSNITGVQGDVSKLPISIACSHRSNGTRASLTLCSPMPASRGTRARFDYEELYNSIFDINVKGNPFTVQKALPLPPDGPSIILNASVVGSKGFSSNSVYSATKAADAGTNLVQVARISRDLASAHRSRSATLS